MYTYVNPYSVQILSKLLLGCPHKKATKLYTPNYTILYSDLTIHPPQYKLNVCFIVHANF